MGQPVELEFKLNDWTFKKVLSSGDCFFVDQSVQELKSGVSKVNSSEGE